MHLKDIKDVATTKEQMLRQAEELTKRDRLIHEYETRLAEVSKSKDDVETKLKHAEGELLMHKKRRSKS
jgi:hypothetical protein